MKPVFRTWGPRPEPDLRTRRSGRRRALTAVAWTLTGLLACGATGLGLLYLKLNGNISGVDINSALGRNRPADLPNGSLDILVLGSDSRAGKNAEYGRNTGTARSDTAMIVHIAADRRHAEIVSIPRDTLVSRPVCRKDGKPVPPDPHAMFNSAYTAGGPICAVKTVEALTGVRMDHYVEVDFTGFKHLIDTLGGVPMTTTGRCTTRRATCSCPPAATSSAASRRSAWCAPGTPSATAATWAASSSSTRSSRRSWTGFTASACSATRRSCITWPTPRPPR